MVVLTQFASLTTWILNVPVTSGCSFTLPSYCPRVFISGRMKSLGGSVRPVCPSIYFEISSAFTEPNICDCSPTCEHNHN